MKGAGQWAIGSARSKITKLQNLSLREKPTHGKNYSWFSCRLLRDSCGGVCPQNPKILSVFEGTGLAVPGLSRTAEVVITGSVIGLEVAVLALLLWRCGGRTKLTVLAWLGFNFCMVHLALWISGATFSCGCFGRLKGTVLPAWEMRISIAAAIFMLIGSLLLLVLTRDTQDRARLASGLPALRPAREDATHNRPLQFL